MAVVQPSLTPDGLTVSIHDVTKKRVSRTRAFPITAPVNSPEWRHELHGVADEVEAWITGQRGIAQSRVAYRERVADLHGGQRRRGVARRGGRR